MCDQLPLYIRRKYFYNEIIIVFFLLTNLPSKEPTGVLSLLFSFDVGCLEGVSSDMASAVSSVSSPERSG